MSNTPGGRAAALRAAEFPRLGVAPYLNAASFAPLPLRSLRAMEAFNEAKHGAQALHESAIGSILGRARAAAARLIGADDDEIALVGNTSVGLSLAAGFASAAGGAPIGGDRRRRRILVSDGEFPANVYPWLWLEREGFTVERVPTDTLGRPREDALVDRLERTDDIAVCALSFVQYASGYRADLARFGRICREREILFVVDAIQGLGAVPLDVRKTPIDVLACGGHKWLCGPFGAGFAYVRRELWAVLAPPAPGWLSFASGLDTTRTPKYELDLVTGARRYENGTLPVQDYAGLAASIDMLVGFGIDAIREHILAVQEPLVTWARDRDDVTLVSDLAAERRSGVISLATPRLTEAHEALQRAGIACGIRSGVLRFSPHVYNTVREMERTVDVLDETLRS